MGETRDYYADLELSPSADINEIKKQFRKLALKYHPDRNPGRETEVNSQFQIIQSAHEVLSDPQQKAKYDTTRSRSGRFPGASGVRGNPWANAGEHFPPPPRRNPNPSTRKADASATSGARRWQTRFAQNGPPPTAKQQTRADTETKKNAAKAFENMRKGQSQSNAQGGQQPRPTPPPPPPRAEYAKQRAEASFGARKNGFYPRSTMGGDEPPVPPRNYYSSRTNTEYPGPEGAAGGASRPVPPIPDPLKQFRESDRDDYSDSRQSTPYSRHGGEKTDPFDGVSNIARAKSTREPSSQFQADDDFSSKQRHRSSSLPRRATDDKKSSPNLGVPQSERRPRTADESADMSFKSRAADAANSSTAHQGGDLDPSGPTIFNFAVDDDAFENASAGPRGFGRSSVDDINTQFVDGHESSAWEFSAGSEGQEPQQPSSRTKPRSNRAGRRSPLKRPTMSRTGSANQTPEAASPTGAFDAEGWSDKFGPQTFVPQPNPTGSASPTRASRTNSRKTKGVKATAGSAAVVDDSSSGDDLYDWRGRKAQGGPAMAESPQAMDIDSPPIKVEIPPPESHEARKIHVEPSRPDWRPGNVDGVNGNTNPQPPSNPQMNPNTVGSEDSDEFRASFADLKNVAPFAQPKTGLKSFTDLKDSLPFESRSAEEVSMKVHKAQLLALPPVPEAPRPPPILAIEGMKPNRASWSKYVEDFENYLKQWDAFNKLVVEHFWTRSVHIAQTRDAKGYAFLVARGESDIQEYYNWVQQDNDVRRRWNEACAGHEKHFREFLAFRAKMK